MTLNRLRMTREPWGPFWFRSRERYDRRLHHQDLAITYRGKVVWVAVHPFRYKRLTRARNSAGAYALQFAWRMTSMLREPSPDAVSAHLDRIARANAEAIRVFEDPDVAHRRLRSPCLALGLAVPMSLLKTFPVFELVMRELAAIEYLARRLREHAGHWAGDCVNFYVMAHLKVRLAGLHLWMRTIGSTFCGKR